VRAKETIARAVHAERIVSDAIEDEAYRRVRRASADAPRGSATSR